MNTIRENLQNLPPEISARAIRAAEMTAPQMLTERVIDPATAIQKGIVWSKTVEGYPFWAAIHSELMS